MGKMSGDPNGAALTTPNECDAEAPAAGSITGCVGRNGAKCAFLSSQRKTKQKKTNQSIKCDPRCAPRAPRNESTL